MLASLKADFEELADQFSFPLNRSDFSFLICTTASKMFLCVSISHAMKSILKKNFDESSFTGSE